MTEIPQLTANDVELRVAQLQQTSYGVYATLLVYKDARTDFAVLNKVFGALGWQRRHDVINGNLYCTVEVWDEEHQRWIFRQDVGVQSNTEAEKGAASDSFKRACFNFGIGVELYDAPIIRFKLRDDEVTTGMNGKPKTYAKFKVGTMVYDRDKHCYTEFTVLDTEGNIRFSLTKAQPNNNTIPKSNGAEPFNEPLAPLKADDGTVTRCEKCNAVIRSPKVIDWSRKKFNKVLCYKCQQETAA